MGKWLKDKKGKFRGTVGAGKQKTPKTAMKVPGTLAKTENPVADVETGKLHGTPVPSKNSTSKIAYPLRHVPEVTAKDMEDRMLKDTFRLTCDEFKKYHKYLAANDMRSRMRLRDAAVMVSMDTKGVRDEFLPSEVYGTELQAEARRIIEDDRHPLLDADWAAECEDFIGRVKTAQKEHAGLRKARKERMEKAARLAEIMNANIHGMHSQFTN